MTKTCPHCRAILSDQSTECPACHKSVSDVVVDKSRGDTLTLGQRIAGVFLLLNSIALMLESLLDSNTFTSRDATAILASGALGFLLILGQSKVLNWAKAAVIIGGVAFTTMYAVQGDVVASVIQLGFSLSLLLLLFGHAGRVRIAMAALLFLAYFVLESAGLIQDFTGRNYLSFLTTRLHYQMSKLEGPEVRGNEFVYTLKVNNDHWLQRSPAEVEKTNPDIDLWLINPSHDAHLFTIVDETEPGRYFALDRLVDVVIENGEQGTNEFEVNDQYPLKSHPGIGEFLDASVTVGDDLFRFYYGIFALNRHAVQVVCYTYDDVFPQVEQECLDMIHSFTPPAMDSSEVAVEQ